MQYLADERAVDRDTAIRDWLEENKTALEATAAGDLIADNAQQPAAHYKTNLEALISIKTEYEQRIEAQLAEAANAAYQEDAGLRMLEERGSKYAQTDLLDSVLFLDGKIVGDPHPDTLKKITIPPRDACNSLVFHADYLTPEYNYSYITVSVSAMIKKRKKQEAELVKLAKIEVPMVRCLSKQPVIETFDKVAAAKMLGVDKCTDMVAKYTVTGAPRFLKEDRKTSTPNKKIQELLESLEAQLSAPEVQISLVHSMCDMKDEQDDPKLDLTYKILDACTDGWSRDKGNPLAVYFVNSPSKEMLDAGTVPKGDKIPFVDQLPARSRFENKKQYMVAMAIGTRQEKEYQDRLHQKLTEVEVPIRLVADPVSMHPKSGAAQEYFILLDTTLVGDKSYLLPRVGDSAKVTLTGVFTKRQDVPEDMAAEANADIVDFIKDRHAKCLKDNSGDGSSSCDDKLFEELQTLCVCDDKDMPVQANLENLRGKIQEISEIASHDELILEFVEANRAWLRLPAKMDDDVNPFTNPVVLHAHRLDTSSTLWAATTQVWKARVPIDKATGSAGLPLILDIQDASRDEDGKILDRRGFTQLARSGKATRNAKFSVVDSDKTYKAEMNAFKKLSAPHTQPLDDRPSVASVQLFEDLYKGELRDGRSLRELMPDLDKLCRDEHPDAKLTKWFKYLSSDQLRVILELLNDMKMIKYIHGPPGTGKTYLLILLVCVTLTGRPPVGSDDDERNLPVDAGKQLNAMDYDKVDQSAALQPVKLTDQQRMAQPPAPERVKILFTSGQNTAVDDLVPRLKAMWSQHFQHLRPEPVILRMHSLEVESKDFPRRLTNLHRQIERNGATASDNIFLSLLLKFSEEVDEYEREGRKNRRKNLSVVDKAIELYEADSNAPQDERKYSELRGHIKKVSENPDNYLTARKTISSLVQDGPQKDAIMAADVIVCTPVGASDNTFRRLFRPHFIFEDEVARDREMSSNILIAHYSPLAYITAGDHKQLGPIVFSTFQHIKYKPKSGFKKEVDMDQATGADTSGDNDTAENDTGKDDATENDKTGTEQATPDNTGEEPEEEPLPNPATFAPQLKKSSTHRLVEAGIPSYQLMHNRRAHGSLGLFFNSQFYTNSVVFKNLRVSEPIDKAVTKWLGQLKGGETSGNSLMLDMKSIEREDGRSFSNIANVNYVFQTVVDLMADVDFAPTALNPNAGKILIVPTYEAQRNLYSSELKKRGKYEHTSEGRFIEFDKSRIEIRSHEGAQGHEASVVIVDLVRSSGPGFTGRSDLLAVCSSRAISGQLVLINKRIIRPNDSRNAPNLRNLVAWMSDHEHDGMFHSLDDDMAKDLRIVCLRCKLFGHKSNECPIVTTGKKLRCPGCGKNHHPRDCCQGPYFISRARPKKETKEPATAADTVATPDQPVMDNAVPTQRSDRAQEFGRATRQRMRTRFAKDKGDGDQDNKEASGQDEDGEQGENNGWGGGGDYGGKGWGAPDSSGWDEGGPATGGFKPGAW